MQMDRLERIRGCLLGGAAGDALGYEVEFITREEINGRYGPGGIRHYALHQGRACTSDDTQMTLFTCEGIAMGWNRAVAGGMAADMETYFYDAYLNWLATQGYPAKGAWHDRSRLLRMPEMFARRAPGNTCLGSLLSGRMGTLGEPINHSKGCGGVMRAAPVGFVGPFGRRYDDCPEDAAVWQGAKVAAITHGHPLGYMPAGMLAEIIRLVVLMDGACLEEIVLAALDRTLRLLGRDEAHASRVMERIIRQAVTLSREDMPDHAAIAALGEGWVGEEALAIAIYCVLKHPDDLPACLCAAVNHSGDSDSTGAIAGNILGARLGSGALAREWVDPLDTLEGIELMARQLDEAAREQGV